MFRVAGKTVLGVETLAKGVNRTCPNVAEHDAERGNTNAGDPGELIRLLAPTFVFGGRCGVPGRDDLSRSCRFTGMIFHGLSRQCRCELGCSSQVDLGPPITQACLSRPPLSAAAIKFHLGRSRMGLRRRARLMRCSHGRLAVFWWHNFVYLFERIA